MTISFTPPGPDPELKPRIVVVGVGGAGGNAVNNMIQSNLEGVEFVTANTDAQALGQSLADRKIQLGAALTQGLGAGAQPGVGRAAAEEAMDEMMEHLSGANMLFITAGMGGGTGTGAAPVLAEAARERGMLTVGVVTKPFHFEGRQRMKLAEQGIEELQSFVDTLIIIPNQNLFRVANEKTTFADAFKMADDVLHSGVRGVTDLMVMPGLINLDFADIRTVMGEMGKAMMGTGEADGEERARAAAEAAISNPLLDDVSMAGARGVLINITGGSDMTLFEVDEAANRIREEVDEDANIIFGSTFDSALEGFMRVSVVATGIESEAVQAPRPVMPRQIRMPRPTAIEAPETVETGSEIAAEAPAIEVETPVAPSEPAAPSEALAELDQPVTEIAQSTLAPVEATTASQSPEPGLFDAPIAQPAEAPAQAEAVPQAAAPVSEQPEQPEQLIQPEAKQPRLPEVTTPRDAFIPPPPADGGRKESLSAAAAPDPYMEAELANGRSEPPKKSPRNIFQRATSLLGGKSEQEAGPAQVTQHPASPKSAAGGMPVTGRAANAAPAPAPATARQPELTSAQPNMQPSEASKADEELLEIPAFLRRQAN